MSGSEYLNDLFAPRRTVLEVTREGIQASRIDRTKRVRKGWGEERWLVDESAPWGFKVIHIRAGQRTSLQYHRYKEEACLILKGEGMLHHAAAPGQRTEILRVAPGDVVHLAPGHVHRFEGMTDLTMIEVSTPHLDDVVRLADDFSRGDGRIATEHETTAERGAATEPADTPERREVAH